MIVHEGVNVRSVGPELLGQDGPVDVLTADLSFISLVTVVPVRTVVGWVKETASL